MSETQLANEPEARTETGEIKDQTSTTPSTETTTPSETKAETKPNEPAHKPSLANEESAATKAEGAPEKYEAFKVPEGFELPEEATKEVNTLFKDLNLSQEQGQRLIDYYAKQSQDAAEAPFKLWEKTQEEWQNQVRNDPEIGPKLNEVRTTISKAIDGMGDAKLASEFRDAMDYTGAGNNLAFIKAFWRLAQKVTEGSHVPGTGPSKFGQQAPGTSERPTVARAMYPNLP